MPYVKTDTHDTRHLVRDRPLVFTGGVVLAGLAGFINVVLLGFFHVPVSHMTGAVSRIGIDIQTGDRTDLPTTLGILGGFLAGAMLSGTIIGAGEMRPGRRYGVALVCEGLLLAGAAMLLATGDARGVPLAAMACGLQNAMASSYYGLVLRTTHVTGIITDLGVMLGHLIRHRRLEPWKPLLLFSLLLGFATGGILGAYAEAWFGVASLILASAGCLVVGAGYVAWRIRHHLYRWYR